MPDDSWKQQLKGPAPLSLAIAAVVWGALLLFVLFGEDSTELASHGLGLPVPAPPVTKPFNRRLATGSEDLPLDDARIRRTAATYEPEQIHIALAGPQGVAISWSSGNATFRLGQDASTTPVQTIGAAASQASVSPTKQPSRSEIVVSFDLSGIQ